MNNPRRGQGPREPLTSVGAKVTWEERRYLESAAASASQSVSEYLRGIIAEHNQVAALRADLEAIITDNNATVTEAMAVIVRGELRSMWAAFGEQKKQLKHLQAGIDKLLGVIPAQEQIKALMAYGLSEAKAAEFLSLVTFDEAIKALEAKKAAGGAA